MKTIIVFSALLISCLAQRSPYAGSKPIGFPYVPPSTAPSSDTALENRFGDETGSGTDIKLPLEALGDVELVRRLLKLPVDQQPFWLINWKALEANRNSVQSYPQRENSFIDGNSQLNTNSVLFER